MNNKVKAAIIGSGNIGTDLMIKILRHGKHIEARRNPHAPRGEHMRIGT